MVSTQLACQALSSGSQAIQRSKTAREAVKTIDHLLQTYGYSSSGESFSIGDTKEAWLMEIYPKGTELGAVWVASRVPDGYVGSHANQARTRTFKMDDPDNVLFAKDVVTYAQRKGWYPVSYTHLTLPTTPYV